MYHQTPAAHLVRRFVLRYSAIMQGVKLIILFGSQATGKAGERSDSDIAILADHALTYREHAKISEEMAGELHVNEDAIDTVDLWDAAPLLQYEVAKKGEYVKIMYNYVPGENEWTT